MSESQQSDLTCSGCGQPVTQVDTFCRNCGALFAEGAYCSNHASVEAEGVCVICSRPYCKDCGLETNRVFLCDPHSRYETQEGMARVYGCFDNVHAQFVTSCLEQAGFHPFLYSRRFNPGAGIPDVVTLTGIRNFGNHPIVELKVLVPFAEVLSAESTLKELLANEQRDDSRA